MPLGALGLLACHRVLAASDARPRGPLDLRGAACVAVGLALLTMSLSFGPEWGWTSLRLLTCLAVALVALALSALIERRVREPIIDFALLRERVFASALGSLTLALLASAAVAAIGVVAALVRGDEQRQLPASAPVTDRAHPRPFHSGPGNGEAPRRSPAA